MCFDNSESKTRGKSMEKYSSGVGMVQLIKSQRHVVLFSIRHNGLLLCSENEIVIEVNQPMLNTEGGGTINFQESMSLFSGQVYQR